MSTFQKLSEQLPNGFVEAVQANDLFEREFRDCDLYWYSPFILWSAEEIDSCQPDYDDSLSGYLAIGGNGGGETYLMNRQDHSIWVADLIAGASSLVRVADSFHKLVGLLEDCDGEAE